MFLTYSLRLDLAWWHSHLGNKDIYLVEVSSKDSKNVPSSWVKSSSTKVCPPIC